MMLDFISHVCNFVICMRILYVSIYKKHVLEPRLLLKILLRCFDLYSWIVKPAILYYFGFRQM